MQSLHSALIEHPRKRALLHDTTSNRSIGKPGVERVEAGQMALFRKDRSHTSGEGEHRAQVVFRWLAKLCATVQPQAAHKAEGGLTTSSTLVMRGCDPPVLTLGFRFKPTADSG